MQRGMWIGLVLALLARTAAAQCTRDADCGGGSVCQQGTCVTAGAGPAAPKPPGGLVPLIERPLILPAGTVGLAMRLDIYNVSETDAASGATFSGTGEALALGADYGINKRLQAGLALGFPLNPGGGFGNLLASAEYLLLDTVAARLDLGYTRIAFSTSLAGSGGSQAYNAFVGGIGLPVQFRLHPMVALVSGRSGAARYSSLPNFTFESTVPGAGSFSLAEYIGPFNPLFGADVLNYAYASTGSGSLSLFTLNLPAGILLQPHERVAVTARIGYTLAHGSSSGGGSDFSATTHYLPLGADVLVTILPQLDVGFAFFLVGPLSTSMESNGRTMSTTVPARNYADGRIFSIFVDGRI